MSSRGCVVLTLNIIPASTYMLQIHIPVRDERERNQEVRLPFFTVMVPCYGLRKDLPSRISLVSQGGAFPEFHFVQDPIRRVLESSPSSFRSKSPSIFQRDEKDLSYPPSTSLETFEYTTKVNSFSFSIRIFQRKLSRMFCDQRRTKALPQKQRHPRLFQSD